MSCDFRLMVKDGKIGQPETRLGLIPGWGGTQRMSKYVGLGWARRLLFSGETISAEEAHRIGLVDEVVPSPEELDAALQRWFKLLAPGSPAAITRIKHALLHHDEIAEFGKCFSASDARRARRRFWRSASQAGGVASGGRRLIMVWRAAGRGRNGQTGDCRSGRKDGRVMRLRAPSVGPRPALAARRASAAAPDPRSRRVRAGAARRVHLG